MTFCGPLWSPVPLLCTERLAFLWLRFLWILSIWHLLIGYWGCWTSSCALKKLSTPLSLAIGFVTLKNPNGYLNFHIHLAILAETTRPLHGTRPLPCRPWEAASSDGRGVDPQEKPLPCSWQPCLQDQTLAKHHGAVCWWSHTHAPWAKQQAVERPYLERHVSKQDIFYL